MDGQALLIRLFNFLELSIILYVFVVNAVYLVLMLIGYFVLRGRRNRFDRADRDVLMTSRLLPAISVLAPAYNEAATCLDSTRAMLQLNYPNHEVVLINDGSTDNTLQLLIEEFRLYKSGRHAAAGIPTRPIRAIYESRDQVPLVVIDKENGGKADSLNAGLNVARSPLVAAVDSDSLIEPDALLEVAKPFLENSELTLASAGIVRVANGCNIEHGVVRQVLAPSSFLAKAQALEYLRAFLGGRVAFSFLNSLLIISGAFGLFRRDALLESGGFQTATVGEDMEIVLRLHRLWRDKRKKYRIVFVPDPVCWTEVPESLRMLHRQRNRWQRGAVESILIHRKMLLNPGYGVLGMFVLPYFTVFEVLGPLVELAGYVVTALGLALGILSWTVTLLFFEVTLVFGVLLSLSAIVLAEFTTRRYPSPFDIARFFWTSVFEAVGLRQLMILWRVQGLVDGLRRKQGWGTIERRGFRSPGEVPS